MRTSVNEEAPRGPLKRMHWEFALPKFPTSTQWLTLAALAGVYLAAAKLGLGFARSEEHTSELQSPYDLVCRLLLEKKKLYTLCYDVSFAAVLDLLLMLFY